jgi:hypothetical protein
MRLHRFVLGVAAAMLLAGTGGCLVPLTKSGRLLALPTLREKKIDPKTGEIHTVFLLDRFRHIRSYGFPLGPNLHYHPRKGFRKGGPRGWSRQDLKSLAELRSALREPAGRAPEDDPNAAVTVALMAQARVYEREGKMGSAQACYELVLTDPRLIASEGDIPFKGSVDIIFRKRAEKALLHIGASPARFYDAVLESDQKDLWILAVKSLERTGDATSLPLVRKLEGSKDEKLAAAAQKTARRITRRMEQKR